MGSLTEKVARGVFWVMLEKVGNQLVKFTVSLVLARLLTPDDFGSVAVLSAFVVFAGVLVDSGFGKALVQKRHVTQTDFSTAFYVSTIVAFAAYWALFAIAPLVARFYGDASLTALLRVLAVVVPLNALNGVQNAELNRKMLFQLSFRITWASTVVTAAAGVGLALAGFGAWALVLGQVAGGVVDCALRQFVIAWRPTWEFSRSSARELFSFGWKNALSTLVNDAYRDLYALVIGRLYSRADLAFLDRGERLPTLVNGGLNGTLTRVSFPAFASMQQDVGRVRGAMNRLVRLSSFFVFPFLVYLMVAADSVIVVLFGEKWLPSAPYLQLICVTQLLTPARTINSQVTIALGRTDRQLTGTLVTRCVCLANLAAALPFGITAFLLTDAFIVSPLGFAIAVGINRHLLGYGFRAQLANLLPAALAAGLLGTVLFVLDRAVPVGHGVRLLLLAAAGIPCYFGVSMLCNREVFAEIDWLGRVRQMAGWLCGRRCRVAAGEGGAS